MFASPLLEICGCCGILQGSHHASESDGHPYNQCPKHEGRMDWPDDDITVFVPTDTYRCKMKDRLSLVFRSYYD